MSHFVKVDKKLKEDIGIVITNTASKCEFHVKVADRNYTIGISCFETMSEHHVPEQIINGYKGWLSKHLDIDLEPNDAFKVSNAIIDIFNRNYQSDLMFSIWKEEIIINNHGFLKPLVNNDPKALNYGVEPGVSYVTVEDNPDAHNTADNKIDATIWGVRPIKGETRYVLSPEHRKNEFTGMLYQTINTIPVNIMVGLLDTFNDNIKRDLRGMYRVTIEKIEE